MKSTKKSLALSVLSLVLCVAMLLGTTFAWFTDSVTSGKNKIIAGNLDIELYHQSKNKSQEKVTEATDYLFKDVELWEPGAYAYETFTVENAGNLALKYKMSINVAEYSSYDGHNLTEVLKVATLDSVPGSRSDITGGEALSTWSLDKNNVLEKSEKDTFTVAVYWEPTDHDDDFNMKNGRPQPLYIDLGIELIATQATVENDSFDNQYDKDAPLELAEKEIVETVMAKAVAKAGEATVFEVETAPSLNTKETTATFEDGALTPGTYNLVCSTQNNLFTVKSAEQTAATIDLKLYDEDNHLVSSFKDGKKVTIVTYITKNLSNVTVKYNGTGADPSSVTYDAATGKLTFVTNHFSEYFVKSTSEAYIKPADVGYNTFDAAFEAAQTNDTVVLLKGVALEKTYDISGKILTVDGGGNKFTRKDSSFTGTFFNVAATGELTLKNAVLDGGAVWGGEKDSTLLRGAENIGIVADASLIVAAGKFTAEKITFCNNGLNATATGAAVTVSNTVTLNDCKVLNNAAPAGGGAFYLNADQIFNLNNCEVIGNSTNGWGGVCRMVSRSKMYIDGGKYNNNKAGSAGVAYVYKFGTSGMTVFDAKNCEIAGNSATTEGGALVLSNTVEVYLDHCDIHDNSSEAGGFAFSSDYINTINLKNSKVYKNKATKDSGGAFRLGKTSFIVENTEMYENTSMASGGAIAGFGGALNLISANIHDNTAKSSPAITNTMIPYYQHYTSATFSNNKTTSGEVQDYLTFGISGSQNFYINPGFTKLYFKLVPSDNRPEVSYKFIPENGYTYTAGDEEKLVCMNEGYKVVWNAADSVFCVVEAE